MIWASAQNMLRIFASAFFFQRSTAWTYLSEHLNSVALTSGTGLQSSSRACPRIQKSPPCLSEGVRTRVFSPVVLHAVQCAVEEKARYAVASCGRPCPRDVSESTQHDAQRKKKRQEKPRCNTAVSGGVCENVLENILPKMVTKMVPKTGLPKMVAKMVPKTGFAKMVTKILPKTLVTKMVPKTGCEE